MEPSVTLLITFLSPQDTQEFHVASSVVKNLMRDLSDGRSMFSFVDNRQPDKTIVIMLKHVVAVVYDT